MNKEKVVNLIRQLRADPRVTLLSESLSPPVSQSEIAEVRSFYQFPESIAEFYGEMNGFELSWNFFDEKSNTDITGLLRFSSLAFLFGGIANTYDENAFEDIFWTTDDDESSLAEKKSYKLLEGYDAISIWCVLVPEENYELRIVDNDLVFKIDYTPDQYFNFAILALGVPYWQYLLVDDTNNPHVVKVQSEVLAHVTSLVPGNVDLIKKLKRK